MYRKRLLRNYIIFVIKAERKLRMFFPRILKPWASYPHQIPKGSSFCERNQEEGIKEMAIFSAIGSSHKMYTCLPGPSSMYTCLPGPSSPSKPSHSSALLTCTNANTHAHRHAHIHTCAHTHVHKHTHTHMCIPLHVYTNIHIHIYVIFPYWVLELTIFTRFLVFHICIYCVPQWCALTDLACIGFCLRNCISLCFFFLHLHLYICRIIFLWRQ